jgi:2-keto-3-deoxy-L-rhamnonate aldolase RhmA
MIESRTALDAVEVIAAIDGIDALFIGPGGTSKCHRLLNPRSA